MTTAIHHIHATKTQSSVLPLQDHVKEIVSNYYNGMVKSNVTPEKVYELVMAEVELPLIEATMEYTGNNQSLAAQILGINRGTFRKKLAFYGVL